MKEYQTKKATFKREKKENNLTHSKINNFVRFRNKKKFKPLNSKTIFCY